MASSIAGVPPRPLTSRATRSPASEPASARIGVEQAVDQRIGRLERRATDARLAVDAQAQLDLVSPSVKPGWPAAGTVQGRQGDAHRPDRSGRRAGLGGDLGQARPRLGRRAGDLVDEDRPGQAATAGVCSAIAGQRHVVGDDHDLDRNPLGPRQLGGQAEVEAVAGVVLDDQERPGGPGDGPDRGEHGVGARRGEHVPRDRRATSIPRPT